LPGFLRHDYVATLSGIDAPLLRGVVLLTGSAPGTTCWDDLAAADDSLDAAVSPRDPAVIFFTSGTTAQAKAVVHSHAALTASARGSSAPITSRSACTA